MSAVRCQPVDIQLSFGRDVLRETGFPLRERFFLLIFVDSVTHHRATTATTVLGSFSVNSSRGMILLLHVVLRRAVNGRKEKNEHRDPDRRTIHQF